MQLSSSVCQLLCPLVHSMTCWLLGLSSWRCWGRHQILCKLFSILFCESLLIATVVLLVDMAHIFGWRCMAVVSRPHQEHHRRESLANIGSFTPILMPRERGTISHVEWPPLLLRMLPFSAKLLSLFSTKQNHPMWGSNPRPHGSKPSGHFPQRILSLFSTKQNHPMWGSNPRPHG